MISAQDKITCHISKANPIARADKAWNAGTCFDFPPLIAHVQFFSDSSDIASASSPVYDKHCLAAQK